MSNTNSRLHKSVLTFYFLLLFVVLGYGQTTDFNFNHISSTDDYSINTIQAIIQDNTGFIWIGTPNGILRYDGFNFISFLHNRNDPKSLSDNFITTMFKDKEGQIWIGTNSGGLNKLNTNDYTFERFSLNGDVNPNFVNNIRVINQDKKGNIWIGTNGAGLYKLNPVTKEYTRFYYSQSDRNSLSNDNVLSIIWDNNDKMYVGTDGGGLNIIDLEKKTFKHLLNDGLTAINSLLKDNDGNIWIGTNNGLFNYNISNENITSYHSSSNKYSLSDNYISSLLLDSQNTLWVGTHNGLNEFKKSENKFIRILNNPTNAESLSDNIIQQIYEDQSGLIWIGTKVGGINTLAKVKRSFKLYRNNPLDKNTISSGSVRSIFVDSSDRLWIGTYGMGLSVFSKDRSRISRLISNYSNQNTISSNSITSICEENKNEYWIGTWNGGLNRITIVQKDKMIRVKNVKTYNSLNEDPNSISSNVIQIVFRDSKGRLWIGTENGLNLFLPRTGKFKKFFSIRGNEQTLSDNRIQSGALIEDQYGKLWIGTWNGLNIVRVTENNDIICEKQLFENSDGSGLSDSRIISLYKDDNNMVWVGTYGGGLNKIIQSEDGEMRIEYFTTNEGLPSNIIYGIQGDSEGNLWLSTHHGISRFNPDEITFLNYDASDGLQDNQFFWGASYKGKNGEIYFGGIDGLNYFYPNDVTTNEYIPPVVITNLEILGQSIKNQNSFANLKEIELEHYENVFSIEFSSLDFTAPHKNNFAYKLEGFDDDWIYSNNRHYVAYTNLSGGDYTFKIKGSNNNNVWNEEGISLNIKIHPPIWATWYAYLLYLSIITLLIGGFIHLKTKKQRVEIELKNKALEEEKIVIDTLKKVDKLKSEFLAQMSHEIRTPINTILSFSSLLKEKYEDKNDDDIITSFQVISGAGERIIRTIDLILNMAEIQTGTYEYLPKQMDLYDDLLKSLCLEFSFLAKEKDLTFDIQNETDNTNLYSDKYIVGQIFNNLLHNAVKYTLNGGIKVKIFRNEALNLIVEVIDTGIGISEENLKNVFDPFTQEEQGYSRQFEGNGLGLALVKEYGKIISAKIEVESKKGSGSTFRVIFAPLNH